MSDKETKGAAEVNQPDEKETKGSCGCGGLPAGKK